MDYARLGTTGLEVSRICLGCMSYGDPSRGSQQWTLDEEGTRPYIRRALEAGVNFESTHADASGTQWRRAVTQGDHVRDRREPAPARHRLRRPVPDPSLGLQHADRGDPPGAHDVVKAGKARYLGASSMYAWQFSKALYTADAHGWTRFVSMQDHYNLLHREEEREMLPLCADQGIGVIPWSPLARGRLTRDLDATTARSETDQFGRSLYAADDGAIIDVVRAIAESRGVSRAQVALAWLLAKPGIVSPIVGATKPHHLEDALAALDVALTADESAALEKRYSPRPVVGF